MERITRSHKIFLERSLFYYPYALEVRPLLKIYQCLGRFPYEVTESGVQPFCPWSFLAIYSMVYYASTSVISFMACRTLFNERLLKAETVDHALITFELILYQAHHVLGPLACWMGSKPSLKYFRLWDSFKGVGLLENNIWTRKMIKYFTITIVPFTIAQVLAAAQLLAELPLQIAITFVPILLTLTTDCMIWFITLKNIRYQTKALVSKINLNGVKHDLERFRITWLCLSQLTTDIGSSTPFVIILNYITCFITLVISAYGFSSNLFLNPADSLIHWGHLMGITYIISNQYVFCQAAYKASRTVGEDFSCHLLSMDFSELSNRSMNQVLRFLRTISNYPPKIRLAGYVLVDKTLIVSFYSNMLSYLVVLLQFTASSTDRSIFIIGTAAGRNNSQ